MEIDLAHVMLGVAPCLLLLIVCGAVTLLARAFARYLVRELLGELDKRERK